VVGTNLSPVKEDSHEYLEGYEKLGSEDEAGTSSLVTKTVCEDSEDWAATTRLSSPKLPSIFSFAVLLGRPKEMLEQSRSRSL
jgi:hypothetical protein